MKKFLIKCIDENNKLKKIKIPDGSQCVNYAFDVTPANILQN